MCAKDDHPRFYNFWIFWLYFCSMQRVFNIGVYFLLLRGSLIEYSFKILSRGILYYRDSFLLYLYFTLATLYVRHAVLYLGTK